MYLAAAVTLFQGTPTDRPTTARLTLRGDHVLIAPAGGAGGSPGTAGVNGSAVVKLSAAAGTSADLCDVAAFVADYELTVAGNRATVRIPDVSLSAAAIDVLLANDITLCISVTADFIADLTITRLTLAFPSGDYTEG